jgi:hypothetical protein
MIGRWAIRVGAHVALVAATVLCTACLAPEAIQVTPRGLNPAFRPDRAAPTAEQLRQAASPELLAAGPWRTAADQIAAPITPVDPLAPNLPQSVCWFMARDDAGGGDTVRGHWEAVFEFPTLDQLGFSDPQDGRFDIGTCRFDDPETRESLRLDGVPQQVRCEELLHVDLSRALITRGSAIFAQCDVENIRLNGLALTARRIDAGGGRFARCGPARSGSVRTERVIRDVDAYAGVVISDLLTTCSDPRGEVLQPRGPTQYAIDAGTGPQTVDPVLLPLGDDSVVAREMTPAAGAWEWSTPTTQRATGARWEESFSSSLRVREVAVFELTPGADPESAASVPQPVAAPGAELCIEDGAVGVCRWRCRDTMPGDGRLSFDLAGGAACRDGTGAPATPLLTPTYAIDTATAGVPAAPLRWRIALPGARRPWVEFRLAALGPFGSRGGGLTASPGSLVLAPVRIGRPESATIALDALGTHPVRITRVAVAPHPQSSHPAEFRAIAIGDPQPLSLPIEIERLDDGKRVVQFDPEFGRLAAVFTGAAHTALWLPRQPPSGLGLTALGRYWLRDAGPVPVDAVGPRFDPAAVRPLVRTTWARRKLPFVLAAGQRAEVLVVGTPATFGTRAAAVQVDWQSTLDPTARGTVQVQVRATGLTGAVLSAMPAAPRLWAPQSGAHAQRTVLLANDGDQPVALSTPRLRASATAALPVDSQLRLELPEGGGGTLAPGQSRLARLHFLGRCDRSERAELLWPTGSGDVVIAIEADTGCP